MNNLPRHPIRVVAERTGLSPDVLRAWQKRYNAVTPGRSDSGQRLYSDADIERLRMIAEAVRAGRSVAAVAPLDVDALTKILREDQTNRSARSGDVQQYIDTAINLTLELNDEELELHLRRALVALGVDVFLEEVLAPTLRLIGEAWERREMTPAHEHLASAVVRRVLEWVMSSCEASTNAPVILATTPPGELHELGALLAATMASLEGWQVRYLGPNLPAADLAHAARIADAKVVAVSALSIDRKALDHFETLLRKDIDPQIKLFIGGAAASHALNLRDFRTELAVLRTALHA